MELLEPRETTQVAENTLHRKPVQPFSAWGMNESSRQETTTQEPAQSVAPQVQASQPLPETLPPPGPAPQAAVLSTQGVANPSSGIPDWPIRIPSWFDLPMEEALDYYEQAIKGAAETGGVEAVNRMRAHLAQNDMFYLGVEVLGRRDLVHSWLFERFREFQASPNGHLDLWARDHYKSTIITFIGLIFEVVNNPEVTIGIFSHTKPTAKGFLRQIKFEFESRKVFHELWPDIFWENPQKQAPTWSEDEGIVVKRKTNPKEATIEAHGLVDGMPTGKHFLIRNYDDVVTEKSVTTPDQILKTTRAWELSDNLGTTGGIERYIGTRYHLFDTYAEMIRRGTVSVRTHAATHDGLETGIPVLLTREALMAKRRKQGVYTFGCQMLQNPTADSAMGFKMEWMDNQYIEISHAQAMMALSRIIIVDPAGSKQRKGNDYTTMWVLGLGADGKWRVLEIVRDRLNLTQRAATLFRLHRHWKPQKVGYEEYGMQADIEHIKYLQEQQLYSFEIIALSGNQMSKENRILRLVPYFEFGNIEFPLTMPYRDYNGQQVDLIRSFIEEEYSAFPVCHHDDMLDSLSRLCDEEMAVQAPVETATLAVRAFDLEGALAQHRFGSGADADNNSWMTA